MPRTLTQETILELKNQLSALPDTEEFREKREKLEVKITSYEIVSTPAAIDFLKDILETKKKLLPKQGIFSFAQILTREQFYRQQKRNKGLRAKPFRHWTQQQLAEQEAETIFLRKSPQGLKEAQEVLQNHFKREFEELYKDNPQQLAQITASP
ncbi:18920_t:CDS:2 [Racocetra persica]|uniref:18920_t:CDS:1 n=1 Tax=Racocetra persica TaxID=160502 RepID=A0ACA9S2U9_9GLOM|nr:18920_t:CDS:2 [Racocetra persica]